MPKQLKERVGKIRVKRVGGGIKKVKIRYLMVAVALGAACVPQLPVRAEGCPDLRVVFVRGSGAELDSSNDYLEFKSTIESKLATTELNYEFIDLDYPAVGVGLDNLDVTAGAFFGSGEAYEFGNSVKSGIKKLNEMVNSTSCPNTKYVLGGYSQGAMVVSGALQKLTPDRIIYAATFGDPKIYLPEGAGIFPSACYGKNLSDYRMYVPDCQAYKGLLGAYEPYEPDSFVGKVGTWCNKRDIFCSSKVSISDHLGYVSDALYEDASKVIFDKVAKSFDLENNISSMHDTAFLIDSTGSMSSMIEEYKNEALRLATETLDSGGRVALYDYRDLGDPYTPVEHCNFETCTLEIFKEKLSEIKTGGGGDTAESLLSASFHAMKALKWKYGSTKSLVVLTDANYLSPDRDGMSLDEVVKVSKNIDPVNFYIITKSGYADYYTDLAARTDGKVVTNFDELSLLTDYIMERYDSLPRVEETEPLELPTLEVEEVAAVYGGVRVKFKTSGTKTIVILNDAILGVTDENEITIESLDSAANNKLSLMPLNNDSRGESIEIDLSGYGAEIHRENDNSNNSEKIDIDNTVIMNGSEMILPKAPNTGQSN